MKLGQVVSTRTDIFSDTYIQVLKTLQDDVPAFSGKRAKEIIARELGRPVDEVFTQFDEKPLAAASLGQVSDGMESEARAAAGGPRGALVERSSGPAWRPARRRMRAAVEAQRV